MYIHFTIMSICSITVMDSQTSKRVYDSKLSKTKIVHYVSRLVPTPDRTTKQMNTMEVEYLSYTFAAGAYMYDLDSGKGAEYKRTTNP